MITVTSYSYGSFKYKGSGSFFNGSWNDSIKGIYTDKLLKLESKYYVCVNLL